MNPIGIDYAGAFVAGVVSFVSPCVLPLVPAYLSFLTGVSYDEIAQPNRDKTVTNRLLFLAAAFVAGFVAVFVALGASATLIGRLLTNHLDIFEKISGAFVVILGLHYLGILPITLLQRDARIHPRQLRIGPLGAFGLGLAFAFGWTPCVGPILATILALAATSGTVGRGVALLASYGLGIGLPFLLAAAAFGPFARLMARLRSAMRAIHASVGILMVATGVLILTNSLAGVSGWLLRAFPNLGRIG